LTTGGIVQIPEAALDFTRSADGRFLYVLGRKVASFAVEPANLLLTALNEVETSLSNWSGLAVDPSRQWLMLSDNTYGIVAFGLRPDGTVVRPNGATLTGQRVSEITFDPAGKILFGLSCSDDIVFRYAFDADNGTLREQTPPVPMPMAGPAQIAFHPTMKVAYVLSSKDQTATSFEYDATTGTLSAPDTIPLVAAGSQALLGYCGPGHIVVHPSGKVAYATTSEGGGSVTVMSVSTSGRLTVVGHEHYFLFRGADALAIDPSGTHLLVGNTAGGLQVFKIDPNDGLLTYVSFGVQGVHALQFLP